MFNIYLVLNNNLERSQSDPAVQRVKRCLGIQLEILMLIHEEKKAKYFQ